LLLSDKQRENLAQLKHKEEEHERHEAGERRDGMMPAGQAGGGRRASAEEVRHVGVGVQGGEVRHEGENDHGGEGKHAGEGRHEGAPSADGVEKLVRKHLLVEERQEGPPAAVNGKKDKKKDPGRGIDTVFRITSNNNQRLSSQADSKAHILIQVNSIIISVLLSLLLRKIEDNTNLAIPAILLLTVNLVTIIFSILATRPHIPPGKFTQADLEEKKVNLLFFGNFYRMTLEEYAGGMLQLLEDRDFLYGSLIRDVYYQGIALGKKYRWLRLSYNVFMYGLIASVVSFLIAVLVYPQK
jgi:hypothetical protein